MTTNKRLHPNDRANEILTAALKVAAKPGGYAKLTRAVVAECAGCSEGLVSKYFGTMVSFKRTIMRAAIKDGNLPILAQGLAAGDKCAMKAPSELKTAAIATLTS